MTASREVQAYSDDPRSRAIRREATNPRTMMQPAAKKTVAVGTSIRADSLSLPMGKAFLTVQAKAEYNRELG
jgi:hypothetical protein